MKRFLREVFIFFIPVIIAFFVFYGIGYITGELKSVNGCISAHNRNRDALFGLGYNDQTTMYKYVNCNERKAKVIALGTSRVMQFREDYFDDSFYNCGGAVGGNYNDYLNFVSNLDYKPEMMIIGIDAWVFNSAWNDALNDALNGEFQFHEIKERNIRRGQIINSMIKDWLLKKWTFRSLNNYPNNIGFNGRVKNAGFMYDGSYYYGNVYLNPQDQMDYEFSDTLYRINSGVQKFEWGDCIDNDTVIQLDNLLEYCYQNDIQVVAFLAPYAPTIYSKMCQSNNYGYLDEIPKTCEQIFNKYNYEFYDFMDGASVVDDDSYFTDGFHGSEVFYGYMILDMIKKGSILGNKINYDKLQKMLENKYNGMVFSKPI